MIYNLCNFELFYDCWFKLFLYVLGLKYKNFKGNISRLDIPGAYIKPLSFDNLYSLLNPIHYLSLSWKCSSSFKVKSIDLLVYNVTSLFETNNNAESVKPSF